jgi:hypothetical protein
MTAVAKGAKAGQYQRSHHPTTEASERCAPDVSTETAENIYGIAGKGDWHLIVF